jgi:hypothetical protein
LKRKCIERLDTEDSRGAVKTSVGSDPGAPETSPVGGSRGDDGAMDAVEGALAKALEQAAAAGRFDVVGQLAAELQARRTARAGNVVDLGARRKGGR